MKGYSLYMWNTGWEGPCSKYAMCNSNNICNYTFRFYMYPSACNNKGKFYYKHIKYVNMKMYNNSNMSLMNSFKKQVYNMAKYHKNNLHNCSGLHKNNYMCRCYNLCNHTGKSNYRHHSCKHNLYTGIPGAHIY